MNTRIKVLFEKYNLSEKHKYEIEQMYWLLPDFKKKNFINNFDLFLSKFYYIENSIQKEKEILLWESVDKIRDSILQNRKQTIDKKIKNEINLLKGEI